MISTLYGHVWLDSPFWSFFYNLVVLALKVFSEALSSCWISPSPNPKWHHGSPLGCWRWMMFGWNLLMYQETWELQNVHLAADHRSMYLWLPWTSCLKLLGSEHCFAKDEDQFRPAISNSQVTAFGPWIWGFLKQLEILRVAEVCAPLTNHSAQLHICS